MRHASTVAAALVATAAALAGCGKDNAAAIDAPPGTEIDAPPGTEIDANTTPLPDAATATCTPVTGTDITTEAYLPAGTFRRPVLLTAPVGDRRQFVVEQAGVIKIIDQGVVLPTPLIDLREDAGGPVWDLQNERGLLGLAFHPDFATNRRFYVSYTGLPRTGAAEGYNVVAEYTVGADGIGDPSSARIVLEIVDIAWNHNGGMIEFSPVDGYLYIATGDGGGGGDPGDNGQDTRELLGKILRIDVDTRTGTKQYGIPATNPYAGSADGAGDPRPEIWAYGLRNPFRFSFDSNGDLWIGDVGQDQLEEIDVQRVATAGGQNYGWDFVEGDDCNVGCPTTTVAPVTVHPTNSWNAIMGGAVYRGSCYPGMVGQYIYSDYGLRQLWAMDAATATNDHQETPTLGEGVTSIHADAIGELYVTLINGEIRHVIAE